ncbi:MAG: tRNA (N(6)-L-threonylcarbamoyladenosine(37)-C(2))-methylthiotransferase MtaB [Planctomycetaceae bacterium]|nr:tRNA (N(6)-L-threonylcarbamoyladenosine(37)-C(2))-methylthiotransferase MtaB [Planctomycetaceae bacterium]
MLLKTATLGCKVNQYETQFVREALGRIGYRDAAPGESADLVIVNTCTVTAESDLKSRKLIRRLARLHPQAEIVVMGCYATRAADDIRQLPRVTEIVTDKRDVPAFLEHRGVIDLPSGITSFGQRHRAYVKVQDGCRVGCAYCIIPKVRPDLLSRPVGEVLDEIRQLVDSGYREIVLTGIHLGHYGLDFDRNFETQTEHKHLLAGNLRLTQLVERILQLDGEFRLRVSSMEAVEVSDELIGLMQAFPKKLCPHLHLSMQSGSDAVLRRMRRRWLSQPFLERCEQIKTAIDRVALTTDVIVGFPGETENQFAETCDMVERIGFSKVHVFPFSPREGTEAAEMPNQIPALEKERRVARLMQLADRLRTDFAAGQIGHTVQVLFETRHNATLIGTSDRYLRTRVPMDSVAVEHGSLSGCGSLVDVTVIASQGEELAGKFLPQQSNTT